MLMLQQNVPAHSIDLHGRERHGAGWASEQHEPLHLNGRSVIWYRPPSTVCCDWRLFVWVSPGAVVSGTAVLAVQALLLL